MHVEVKELSAGLRAVLARVAYHRADIAVEAAETVDVHVAGGSGRRGFAFVVNLDTGAFEGRMGSWGGQNMFVRGPVDDGEVVSLPENGAVVKGTTGNGTYARIFAHPAAFGRLLPSGEAEETLTDEEAVALGAHVCLKGGQYRRDCLQRNRVRPETIDGLVDRGYLKRNRAGATQVTTKGRNAPYKRVS